jgi:hypothetical protein
MALRELGDVGQRSSWDERYRLRTTFDQSSDEADRVLVERIDCRCGQISALQPALAVDMGSRDQWPA